MNSPVSYSPPHGSTGHKALGHIYQSTKAAYAGNFQKAEHHIKQAHTHVGDHVKELTQAGKHKEATQFNTAAQSYLLKLDHLISERKKWTKKSEGEEVDVQKSFGAGVAPPPPNSKIQDKQAVGQTNKVQKINRHPGYQAGVDYKPFHEMSPEDQKSALHAYGEKDMAEHLYAHDPKTGSWNYGKRWKAPAEMLNKPQANEGFSPISPVKPQLSPQHKSGAGVRIHAEGHELHGKLGVVQHPNPQMPGKVGVKLQNKGRFETHYLEPDQVKLSKLANVVKSEVREAASEIVNSEKAKVLAFPRKKKE